MRVLQIKSIDYAATVAKAIAFGNQAKHFDDMDTANVAWAVAFQAAIKLEYMYFKEPPRGYVSFELETNDKIGTDVKEEYYDLCVICSHFTGESLSIPAQFLNGKAMLSFMKRAATINRRQQSRHKSPDKWAADVRFAVTEELFDNILAEFGREKVYQDYLNTLDDEWDWELTRYLRFRADGVWMKRTREYTKGGETTITEE